MSRPPASIAVCAAAGWPLMAVRHATVMGAATSNSNASAPNPQPSPGKNDGGATGNSCNAIASVRYHVP